MFCDENFRFTCAFPKGFMVVVAEVVAQSASSAEPNVNTDLVFGVVNRWLLPHYGTCHGY